MIDLHKSVYCRLLFAPNLHKSDADYNVTKPPVIIQEVDDLNGSAVDWEYGRFMLAFCPLVTFVATL